MLHYLLRVALIVPFLGVAAHAESLVPSCADPSHCTGDDLQRAIDAAPDGSTLYLSECHVVESEPDGVVCPSPRTWHVGRLIKGRNGLTYDGHSNGGARSVLRLIDFDPELETWAGGARGRDTLSFYSAAPTPEPTVIQHLVFDGNIDGQAVVQCGPGHWVFRGRPCSEPCPDCEPKQEGLFLTAAGGTRSQRFILRHCELRNHLWVGLQAWHHAVVEVNDLVTRNNRNAVQGGGHNGTVRLTVDGWTSIGDQVGYRGEVEGELESGSELHITVRNAEFIDPRQTAFTVGVKNPGEGASSRYHFGAVETRCETLDCRPRAHLVPRRAQVVIEHSRLVGQPHPEAPSGAAIAVYMNDVSGSVTLRETEVLGTLFLGHDPGVGTGGRVVLDEVTTGCPEDEPCASHLDLVPRETHITIRNSQIQGRADDGMALHLQYFSGSTTIENTDFAGYVLVGSVFDGFEPAAEAITFDSVRFSGCGGSANNHPQRFAIFNAGNALSQPQRRLRLQDVRVAPEMDVDGLLYLLGGRAEIDVSSYHHNRLPVVVAARADRYTSTFVLCRTGDLECQEPAESTVVDNRRRTFEPGFLSGLPTPSRESLRRPCE